MRRRGRQVPGGYRHIGNVLKFTAYGLVAAWDSSKPATKAFNGNDISGLASIVPGAIDVAQAVGANQPLGAGTPQYGEFVSIQFTAANADRLVRANTNLIADNPATFVSVQKIRNAVGAQSYFMLNVGALGMALGEAAGVKNWLLNGVSNRVDGAIGTTAPEVWIGTDSGSGSPVAQLWINGVVTAITNSAANRGDPGAAADLLFGGFTSGLNSDFDFCFAAVFQSQLPDSVVIRISHALGARGGLAA